MAKFLRRTFCFILSRLRRISRISAFAFSPNFPFMDIPTTQIVADFRWPSLKAVSLIGICSHEHELGAFLYRHAHTLKQVSLEFKHQYEGLWHMTFQEIRRAFAFRLQLNSCKLDRFLSSPENGSWVGVEGAGTVVSHFIKPPTLGIFPSTSTGFHMDSASRPLRHIGFRSDSACVLQLAA